MSEQIVAAAQRIAVPDHFREEMWNGQRVYPDYLIVSCPQPGRHHTNMHPLADLGINVKNPANQGFLTSTGRWVDRVEGLQIAYTANQVKEKHGNPDMLFSEDMW